MGSRRVAGIFLLLLLASFPIMVNSNCREVKLPRDCEALCTKNRWGSVSCELRAAVLLPLDASFDISLLKVMPVLDLAVYHARAQKILPDWLQLTFLPKNDRCDATYAQMAAIDSYVECVHLFLGPACDYCIANVGRIAKFLNIPLITTGGFTFDFTAKKTSCPDEYFMTTRVGSLAFGDISNFLLTLMDSFNWRKIQLVYDPSGQYNFAGRHTCHLMMKSLVKSIKSRPDVTFGSFDIEAMSFERYRESLKSKVGYEYSDHDTNLTKIHRFVHEISDVSIEKRIFSQLNSKIPPVIVFNVTHYPLVPERLLRMPPISSKLISMFVGYLIPKMFTLFPAQSPPTSKKDVFFNS